jgi:hypothetical protein
MNQIEYIRPTYGITGSIGEFFNAIGSIAHSINNVASGASEFTEDLPRLGKASGEALSVRAEQNLKNQLSLANLES